MHIISFIITWLLIFGRVEGDSISETLQNISVEDREKMTRLFSFLFKEEQLGYTLFGDKPIALTGVFIITPWENIVEQVNDQDGIIWRNWKTWEKYQDFSP